MTNHNHREKRQAKLDGASPVKNSGRGFMKGDARWKRYLVDYKHNAKSFTLTQKSWSKHATDAWNDNHRIPMVKVIFEDGTAVAAIPWDVVVELESDDEL